MADDRFNATVAGRATARRAGGLQVPVRLDTGAEALAAYLAEAPSALFRTGRRALIEDGRLTELGA